MANGLFYHDMGKCLYMTARALHQNYRWFSLKELHELLIRQGFIFGYTRVCGCAAELFNQGYASRVRVPQLHGVKPFYKWHSHILDEPDELEDYYEPIPRNQITLDVQLSGEELDRYLWCKERRDAYYCGKGVREDD